MKTKSRSVADAVLFASFPIIFFGCTTTPVTLLETSVGKSVTTLQKTHSITGCLGTTPPDLPQAPQDWWNQMPPANHQYPFAGWQAFQTGPGGCAATRVDAYRAVVTFNLASVTNLTGLVKKAELIVTTRALPSAAGMTLNAGPLGQAGSINLFCPAMVGGAGALVPFGPGDTVPTTNPTGSFEELGANPFPTGRVPVYTFPTNNFVSGPVAGATQPTTASPIGNGGSVYVTDVTARVVQALNVKAPALSWMLISNQEADLPGALTAPGDFDCRTSYDIDLKITHF